MLSHFVSLSSHPADEQVRSGAHYPRAPVMTRSVHWIFLSSCVVFLAATVAVEPARADLITGQYTSIEPSAGSDQATFTLNNGTVVMPGSVTGDPANNLLVDVTLFDPVHGNSGVTLNDTSPTPQFIITNPVNPLTQMVILDFANPAVLFNNNSAQGTGSISVGLTLDPTSPGIPFFNQNAFAEADLTINFTGIQVVSSLPDGSPDGRASWTGPITATFQIQSVPEPSTLVLTMAAGMTLAGARWVRRHKPSVSGCLP